MADRQGLLQGRRLSRVQHMASEVLLAVERRDRDQMDAAELERLLIANDPEKWLPLLYPTLSEASSQTQGTEGYDLDNSEGDWVFTDKVTPEEVEKMLSQMAREEATGRLSFPGADEDGWTD